MCYVLNLLSSWPRLFEEDFNFSETSAAEIKEEGASPLYLLCLTYNNQ